MKLYHVTPKHSVASILEHGLRGRRANDLFFRGKGPIIWLQSDLDIARKQLRSSSLYVQTAKALREPMALLAVDVQGYELHPDPHSKLSLTGGSERNCVIF